MRRLLRDLGPVEMRYMPLWAVHTGDSVTSAQPALVTTCPEVWKLDVSAQLTYDLSSLTLPEPEVPLRAALAWLERDGGLTSPVRDVRLVYVPVYTMRFVYEGEPFSLLIEGATGRVLVDYPPAYVGWSWNAICYLCYGALILTGTLLALFAEPIGRVAGSLREDIWDLLARLPQPWLAAEPMRLVLSVVRLLTGPLVGPLIWLAVLAALALTFTGTWKPHRWFRSHQTPGERPW
jgi:hypothetical protein